MSQAPVGVMAAVLSRPLLNKTLFQCCSMNGIPISIKRICLNLCNSPRGRERPC